MTEMHYEDPQFEIVVDDDAHEGLLDVHPVRLERSDEPPTGEHISKTGDHTDEDGDEVLREI